MRSVVREGMPHITGTCDWFEVKRLLISGLKLATPAFTIPATKPEVQRRCAMGVDLSEGRAVVGCGSASGWGGQVKLYN
jgi:hypothetical protein